MGYAARDFLADQLVAAAPEFNWSAAEVDRAHELADILLQAGITDLSRLQLVKVQPPANTPYWADVDTATHLALRFNGRNFGYLGEADNVRNEPFLEEEGGKFRVAWSARGHGNVSYYLVVRPNGFAIAPVWGSSSDLPDIREAMRVGAAIALTIVLPAGNINAAQSLGQAILGPIVGPVSPALAGALGQVALTTAFNGGDVEGALKTTARGLIASGAGAEVGEGLTNAGTSEVIGRVGSSATAALINGKDVEKAVGESLLRNAPDLVQNAPPKGNTMTAPFESDFGVPNEVQTDTTDYSQFDAFNEYPASTGDFQPLTNNLQPLTTPEILVAQSLDPGTGAGMVFPDIATPASLDDTRVTVGPFDPKHVEVKPAPQSSDPYGNTFRDVAVGVSTAATAALALVKLYDATQGVNTQARVTQTTPQGRATVVALDSGIVQTRNPDGTVTNKRPPVGVAQTTVGGNIVVNNGDGTYTSIAPNGAKSVYAYDPTQSSDTFGDKLKAIPPALWFGGIGLLIAALRS